jgi:hypothetical protein
MQHTMALAIAPTRNARLATLLELYGCADVVAPVDAIAYGRRAGQLIGRIVGTQKAFPATEEPIRHTTSAQKEGGSLLEALETIGHAPRSDRLTLLLAASASLLMAGSALLYSLSDL